MPRLILVDLLKGMIEVEEGGAGEGMGLEEEGVTEGIGEWEKGEVGETGDVFEGKSMVGGESVGMLVIEGSEMGEEMGNREGEVLELTEKG